ncbi:IS630 family transposase, partial [Comamonadaceae bacterium OH2545_COT-014]
FVEKVRDVVGLYLDPPDRALVLCVDEKSQIGTAGQRSPTQAQPSRHAQGQHY